MRFFKNLFVFMFMVLLVGAGLLVLAMSLDIVPLDSVIELASSVRETQAYQITAWAVAAAFILLGVILPLRSFGVINRNKFLTFRNPDGEVTISVGAIEDYVRKVARTIPEITGIRPRVDFTRKGINVVSEVSIRAGANIPEVVERIQIEVRNKVQGMIGIEANLNISVYVNKIVGEVAREAEGALHEEEAPGEVPFR